MQRRPGARARDTRRSRASGAGSPGQRSSCDGPTSSRLAASHPERRRLRIPPRCATGRAARASGPRATRPWGSHEQQRHDQTGGTRRPPRCQNKRPIQQRGAASPTCHWRMRPDRQVIRRNEGRRRGADAALSILLASQLPRQCDRRRRTSPPQTGVSVTRDALEWRGAVQVARRRNQPAAGSRMG